MTEGYRALQEGVALISLRDHGRIIARGEDRARLIHALTTNHIQEMQPGQGKYCFFLTAQGRIVADANLVSALNGSLLRCESTAGSPERQPQQPEQQNRDHFTTDEIVRPRSEEV